MDTFPRRTLSILKANGHAKAVEDMKRQLTLLL